MKKNTIIKFVTFVISFIGGAYIAKKDYEEEKFNEVTIAKCYGFGFIIGILARLMSKLTITE